MNKLFTLLSVLFLSININAQSLEPSNFEDEIARKFNAINKVKLCNEPNEEPALNVFNAEVEKNVREQIEQALSAIHYDNYDYSKSFVVNCAVNCTGDIGNWTVAFRLDTDYSENKNRKAIEQIVEALTKVTKETKGIPTNDKYYNVSLSYNIHAGDKTFVLR